jgi:hypothetical protein
VIAATATIAIHQAIVWANPDGRGNNPPATRAATTDTAAGPTTTTARIANAVPLRVRHRLGWRSTAWLLAEPPVAETSPDSLINVDIDMTRGTVDRPLKSSPTVA